MEIERVERRHGIELQRGAQLGLAASPPPLAATLINAPRVRATLVRTLVHLDFNLLGQRELRNTRQLDGERRGQSAERNEYQRRSRHSRSNTNRVSTGRSAATATGVASRGVSDSPSNAIARFGRQSAWTHRGPPAVLANNIRCLPLLFLRPRAGLSVLYVGPTDCITHKILVSTGNPSLRESPSEMKSRLRGTPEK